MVQPPVPPPRLRIAAAIAAIIALSTTSSTTHASCSRGRTPEDPLDVLIVGAGWSGLAAGNRLWNNPDHTTTNICVLEAHDAIGGRSRTKMGLFEPGLPTELGSAWIYEGSNVFQVFQEAGLVTDTPSHFDFDELGLYGVGDDNEQEQVRKAYEDFVKFAKSQASPQVSLQTILDRYLPTVTDNLERQTILGLVTMMMHTEWGADLTEANSWSNVPYLTYDYGMDYAGVPGSGFQPALDHFAAPLVQNHNLQLNTQVLSLDHNSNNTTHNLVKVTSKDRLTNETSVRYARAAICTVSLGVLQHGDLTFVPALPSWKQRAIQDMGMGNKNKCILYWDNSANLSWWPHGQHEMLLITPVDQDSNDWTFFSNDQVHKGHENIHVLTAWVGGYQADAWEQRTDEENLAQVMANLRHLFPTAPDPTKYILTRWGSDPFVRGTYSYYKVGVDYGAASRALAAPIGTKLYFAGEATTSSGMGAPNAYQSGDRAVWQLVQSGVLTQPPLPPTPAPAGNYATTTPPVATSTTTPPVTTTTTTPPVPDTIPADCQDNRPAANECPYWAQTGECDSNPSYMHVACIQSCGLCANAAAGGANTAATTTTAPTPAASPKETTTPPIASLFVFPTPAPQLPTLSPLEQFIMESIPATPLPTAAAPAVVSVPTGSPTTATATAVPVITTTTTGADLCGRAGFPCTGESDCCAGYTCFLFHLESLEFDETMIVQQCSQ